MWHAPNPSQFDEVAPIPIVRKWTLGLQYDVVAPTQIAETGQVGADSNHYDLSAFVHKLLLSACRLL